MLGCTDELLGLLSTLSRVFCRLLDELLFSTLPCGMLVGDLLEDGGEFFERQFGLSLSLVDGLACRCGWELGVPMGELGLSCASKCNFTGGSLFDFDGLIERFLTVKGQ